MPPPLCFQGRAWGGALVLVPVLAPLAAPPNRRSISSSSVSVGGSGARFCWADDAAATEAAARPEAAAAAAAATDGASGISASGAALPNSCVSSGRVLCLFEWV
jgi:hypothetical protein